MTQNRQSNNQIRDFKLAGELHQIRHVFVLWVHAGVGRLLL